MLQNSHLWLFAKNVFADKYQLCTVLNSVSVIIAGVKTVFIERA